MHLGVVTHIVSSLSPELRARFEAATGCRDERVVNDVIAVLGIVDLGMRTGKALPALLPGPLAGKVVSRRGMKEEVLKIMGTEEIRDVRRYCSAVEGWAGFLEVVDEIVDCMKEVLGEWGAWEAFVEDVEDRMK